MIVDSREPHSFISELRDEFNNVVVGKLEAGDIFVPDVGLLIERKTVSDLLRSIADGALMDQCSRMVALDVKYPTVLVHGSLLPNRDNLVVADGRTTKWNYWSVIMTLYSVQGGGVPVLMVPDRLKIDAIKHLITYASKGGHRVIRKTLWSVNDPGLQMLTILAGNRQRAQKLLEYFGTPAVAIQYVHDWQQVKGIGNKTVERALDILLKMNNGGAE